MHTVKAQNGFPCARFSLPTLVGRILFSVAHLGTERARNFPHHGTSASDLCFPGYLSQKVTWDFFLRVHISRIAFVLHVLKVCEDSAIQLGLGTDL